MTCFWLITCLTKCLIGLEEKGNGNQLLFICSQHLLIVRGHNILLIYKDSGALREKRVEARVYVSLIY